MANLDYLKIGNFIKQETIGCYSGNIQASIIQIKQLEVNDKTAWVNVRRFYTVFFILFPFLFIKIFTFYYKTY